MYREIIFVVFVVVVVVPFVEREGGGAEGREEPERRYVLFYFIQK